MNTELIKKKILDLAIKGKLVEQRPEEGTAEDLYNQIQEEKKKLIADGKIKKEKPLPEISEHEMPFEIPKSWKWVRLLDLFNVRSARRIHQTDWCKNGIPFFRGRELVSLVKKGNANPTIFISKELYEQLKQFGTPRKNDILISAVGSIGFSYVLDEDSNFYYKDAYILCLENYGVNPYYIKNCLDSVFLQKEIHDGAMATTVEQLTIDKTKSLLLPLPPLSEQKRIVDKVEEIFSRIDVIKKAKSDLAKDGNLLEKKILDLAIRGKLVNQRPEEGTAEELYAQIQEEKNKLIAEGKIKKEKPLPEITEEEIPFDIPESWKWVRLKQVCSNFIVPQRDKPKVFSGNIPWCRIEDIEGMFLSKTHSNQYVSEETIKQMNLKVYPIGTVISANSASIGAAAITTVECCTNQTFIGLVCQNRLLYNYFLYYFLICQKNNLKKLGTGTTISYISREKYENYVIPLPPLAEQKRIVKKIEELLPYCYKLKE